MRLRELAPSPHTLIMVVHTLNTIAQKEEARRSGFETRLRQRPDTKINKQNFIISEMG